MQFLHVSMIYVYELGVDRGEVLIFGLVSCPPYPAEGAKGILGWRLGELGVDSVLNRAVSPGSCWS